MKIPETLKNIFIVVIGIFILLFAYSFVDKDPETDTNDIPTEQPVMVPVDYSKINDPEIAQMFKDLSQIYPLSNMYTSHVVTVYEGFKANETYQYTVEYKHSTLGERTSLEDHSVVVDKVAQFFRDQAYQVEVGQLNEYPNNDINTSIGLAKNDLGCQTWVSNWGSSVLLCQRQVPLWNKLSNEVAGLHINAGEVAIRYISGNYVRGTLTRVELPEKTNWLAVRQDDKWISIAEGDTWSCDLMNQYKVPIEIYKECN